MTYQKVFLYNVITKFKRKQGVRQLPLKSKLSDLCM